MKITNSDILKKKQLQLCHPKSKTLLGCCGPKVKKQSEETKILPKKHGVKSANYCGVHANHVTPGGIGQQKQKAYSCKAAFVKNQPQ